MNLTGTVNATTSGNVIIQTLGAGQDPGRPDAFVLGTITANNLTVTANGAVTQSGPSSVSGVANFTNSGTGSGGNITLANSTNNFSTVTACGTNITVNDTNAVILGTTTATDLTVTAGGAITQTGVANVTGTANFTSTGNIALDQLNLFTTILANGTSITVNETNNLTIGAITANGDFTVQGDNTTSCISVTGPIDATSGTGNVSLTGRNIVVTGNISTANGDISLYGNGGGVYQTGTFDGVWINGAGVNVNTTGGNITIDGRGAMNSNMAGVNLTSSTVQATGSGCVTITGISGNGSGGSSSFGIKTNGIITTSLGSITVNGTSCGTAVFSGGVLLGSSSNISVNGAGNVTITGNADNGDFVLGIYAIGSITTSSGSITVNGTSSGTGNYSIGVGLEDASISANGTGNVTITGNAANATDLSAGILAITSSISANGTGNVTITGTAANALDSFGIYAQWASITTSSGSLTVNGTSCGTGSNSTGVYLNSSSNISATGAGNVTIIGSTPGNNTGVGINSANAGDVFYSNGGLITLNANSVNLTGTVNATSAGNVIIQTLGAGQDPGRSDAVVLGTITANNLTVTANGAITQVGAAYVSNIASITNSGTGSGGNITLSNSTNDFSTVTACGTNITINDTNNLTLGSIAANGTVQITAQNVTITSNVTSTGTQQYNGSVILNQNATLTTTDSNIQFSGTLVGSSHNLDIATGTGNVSFGGNVSGINNATFNSANQITATGSFAATNLFLNGGTLNANTAFTTALKVNGGTANIQTAGSLTGNANVVSGSLISANLITGTLTTNGGETTLASTSNVTGATTVNSGNLTNAGRLSSTLTINGGSANMQTGAITTGLATLAGGNLTSNAAFNGGLTATGGTLYTLHNGTTTTTLTLANGSTWNAAGANYTSDFSQISASTVIIGSTANLTLTAAPMKALQNFTLINNTGRAAISGNFNGLPQGIDYTSNGMPLRFNYSGGTGTNDLVLTDYPTRLKIVSGQNMTAANGVVYASNLTIQVLGGTNNATPVDGAHVIFTLPGQLLNMSIASGYFNGVNDSANLTANVLTGSDGNATIQLWGGVNAGPFNIQPVVSENTNAKDLNNGNLTMPVTYNLGVVGLSVQKQSINRSNVRYLDLVLADPASIPDIAALNSNIVLQKIATASMSGGANITASNITMNGTNAVKTTVGWTFDFGTGGIGTGGADSIEADGVYQFANMTGSPSVGLPRSYPFHRLLGDANGDKIVTIADTALVNTLTSTLAWRYNNGLAAVPQGELFYIGAGKWAGDMNGDGRVNATDVNITGRWRGRRVTYTY